MKLAIAAGASLLLLVPAFNSLNQVTVKDVKPPLTLDDPPNVPPPDLDGEQQFDVEVEEGPQPSAPDCPPPKAEEAMGPYTWDFPPEPPPSPPVSVPITVEPGSAGIGVAGNVSNFFGHVRITLTDPSGSENIVYEYSSVTGSGPEDTDRVHTEPFGTIVQGAVPGTWTLTIFIGAPEEQQPASPLPVTPSNPASGHVDVQAYQAFPCGGLGRG